jgi:hypothetical protein
MPDAMRISMSMFPERVSVLMAIVIVSWPLSMPVLAVIVVVKAKEK